MQTIRIIPTKRSKTAAARQRLGKLEARLTSLELAEQHKRRLATKRQAVELVARVMARTFGGNDAANAETNQSGDTPRSK